MIDRLYLLFEVLALLAGLFALHEKRRITTIADIFYIAADLIVESSIELGWLPQEMEAILYIGLIIFCMFEFGDKLYDACLYAVVDIVLIGVVQIVCVMVACLLLRTLYVGTLIYFLINIATFIIILLIHKYGKLSKYIMPVLNNGIAGKIILAVAALVCLYSFGIFKKHDKIYWKTALEMAICIFVFAYLIFQWQKEKWLHHQKDEELKTFQKYNEIYKELIEEVRGRQHDFNNHLQAIFSMNALTDDLSELVEKQNEYCSELVLENMANKLLREDIPSVLAGFMYTKINQAKKKNILVRYRIVIHEVEKYIRFPDLVEIIGNLFDNALEAVAAEEQKVIECYVMQSEDDLTIEVSNPCEWKSAKMEGMTENGKSTKGKGRGLGLGNVKRTVEKYNGIFQIKNVEKMEVNYIVFRVRMPLYPLYK